MQAIAAGRPGVITHIGLGTTVDPRMEGGRLNQRAEEALVEVIELEGREWLRYKPFPIHVALIRGSVIDEMGNLTMEHEGLYASTLSAAQAARNSGGIVIAQAKYLAQTGTLDPRRVKVPGVLVDAVVIHPNQALSIEVDEDPALWGELRIPQQGIPQLPLNERKIISRRAAQELRQGDMVNLGFGLADGVAAVLAEEGISDAVTFTLEQGHIGGIPAAGANFGLARNQQAMVDAAYQFDWYDGGGLDITIISFAQVDAAGNVNVSKFGNRIAGVGGFINITQGAKRIVFVGTFMAGKLNFEFGPDGMRIIEDGSIKKFVSEVEQISFNAKYAWARGRSVKYVTERAVFELADEGLLLTEIAPDINLERDILNQMAFRPVISPNLGEMDKALFRSGKLGLTL
jgi:propionate CoA-transferase